MTTDCFTQALYYLTPGREPILVTQLLINYRTYKTEHMLQLDDI